MCFLRGGSDDGSGAESAVGPERVADQVDVFDEGVFLGESFDIFAGLAFNSATQQLLKDHNHGTTA